jgi:hypothetical protein
MRGKVTCFTDFDATFLNREPAARSAPPACHEAGRSLGSTNHPFCCILPQESLDVEHLMAERLDGKVAIVTGGSRGIGRAILHRLGRPGAAVVLAARLVDALAEAAGLSRW